MTTSTGPSNLTAILDDQIKTFFDSRLNPPETAHGISVGLVDASSDTLSVASTWSGQANVATNTPVTQDTVFEIGSVTKTFTATMLANQVYGGTMALSDTAQHWYDKFGASVTLPTFTTSNGNVVQMTLQDVGDFTSGFDTQNPDNVSGPDYSYSVADMRTYLSDMSALPYAPGTFYRYANTDFGILADLMCLQAGVSDYSDVLSSLIADARLTMPDTGVIPGNTPSIANLAQGYDLQGKVVAEYGMPTWPAFLGAGGIYSTINDMLEWLQFNMGVLPSPMGVVLDIAQTPYFQKGPAPGYGSALAWEVGTLKGDSSVKVIFKNGGTNGFHAWIGFLPEHKIGTVLLCNASLPAAAPENKGQGSPVDNTGQEILLDVLQKDG